MADEMNEEWICSTLIEIPDDQKSRDRGVLDLKDRWDSGQIIKVGFLEGSTKLKDRVFKTAQRWTIDGEGGANLKFEKVADPEQADIRVAFDRNAGSWSYVGKKALDIQKRTPTMNLGWVSESTAEKSFASVVLHEFGHAIGLLHEHNHPQANLKWKKDVVYADLMGPPNNWSKKTIDFNVFESYPESRVVCSEDMDRVSIMIYTIPARWLDGQPGIMPSDHLSEDDIKFIRQQYN